jgi:hypothetical protein
MRADEHGLLVANQCAQSVWQRIVKDILDQIESGTRITAFGGRIGEMLFDPRFGGVDQDIGEVTPGTARRLHRQDGSTADKSKRQLQ